MIGDFEVPERLRGGQSRALARYLRNQVAPYSPHHGPGLAGAAVTGTADLARLPVLRLEEVADPAGLVLRPTPAALDSCPDRRLRLTWWWARARGRTGAFNRRVIEPRYKPVHWHHESIPIGYSASDLDRLAELGRRTLELAGVGAGDVLVGVTPPGPNLAFWQLALGARKGAVAALFGSELPVDELARLRPTVLAGRDTELLGVLGAARAAGLSLSGLRTLLAVGRPLDPGQRQRLTAAAGSGAGAPAVVAAWAPPGVRAMWAECREGTDVHTWPGTEVVEIVDPVTGGTAEPGSPGEVVWSPLGWHGTVALRLGTGHLATVEEGPCVFCGRTTPRLRLQAALPPFARVLEDHPDVAAWQAELRTVDGAEELIVFLATGVPGHPGRLLRQLDRQLSVTQFVVLDPAALDARLRAGGGDRIVDLRL